MIFSSFRGQSYLFFHYLCRINREKIDKMSAESKYTKEFEDYWKTHEAALLRVAPKVLRDERANNGKMNTAGDWLLFIIPIMAMVRLFCFFCLHQALCHRQTQHRGYRRRYQGLLLRCLSAGGTRGRKATISLIYSVLYFSSDAIRS